MRSKTEPRFTSVFATFRPVIVSLAALWAASGAIADDSGARAYLERPGGARAEGRLLFDARSGLRFLEAGADEGRDRAVEPGEEVEFAPPAAPSASVPPLFRVDVGQTARISGTLRSLSEQKVILSVPWQSG